ncbi:MAG: NAD-dependent epimerase/dehydratase family protein [Verrucomicrobiota bacterium]
MRASPTVLVTGGTGFIGRHLVRQMLRNGEHVRLLCRSAHKAEALFGEAPEIVTGDIASGPALAAACQGIQSVYHIAGLYEFGARHRSELWRVNVEGTRAVLSAARAAGVARVVHCSTAGILSAPGRLIHEEDLPGHPPAGCGYKISKWNAERLALEAAESGMDVVIASPTAPIGSGDERPTPTGRMILDLMRDRFPGCSRTGLNLVAVDDVATGLLAVGRSGIRGRRYILGHENLWLEEFLRRAARHIGCRAPRAWIPWPLVAAAGVAGDLAGLVTGNGDDRLCWETAYFARQVQFFDLSRNPGSIGWQAIQDLDSAIAEGVGWFRWRDSSRAEAVPASGEHCISP